MKDNIKVDFENLLVGDLMDLINNPEDPKIMFGFADKVIVGGIKDRPLKELSVILDQVTKALLDHSDDFSMVLAITEQAEEYLKDNDTV
jgi:hypothetical protein